MILDFTVFALCIGFGIFWLLLLGFGLGEFRTIKTIEERNSKAKTLAFLGMVIITHLVIYGRALGAW